MKMKIMIALILTIAALTTVVGVVSYLKRWAGKPIQPELSNQYHLRNGKVYFTPGNNRFELGTQLIAEADPETFEVLASNFAKDSKHAYFNARLLEGADPTSFFPVKQFFSADAKKLFFMSELVDSDVQTNQLEVIHGHYITDKRKIWYRNKLLSAAEPLVYSTIKRDTDGEYMRIGNEIFFYGETRPVKNPEKFEVYNGKYGTDEEFVYLNLRPLPWIDAAQLRIINNLFQADYNQVYYLFKPVPESHPASFAPIKGDWYADKNQFYRQGYIVKEIGNATDIGHFDEKARSMDYALLIDNRWYLRLVKKNDLKFLDENDYYSIDKNTGKYYNFRRSIENLHIDSFRIINNFYCADTNAVFYMGSKLKHADPASFQLLNEHGFSRDKNNLYWNSFLVLDIHPDDFVHEEGMYGFEQNEEEVILVRLSGL